MVQMRLSTEMDLVAQMRLSTEIDLVVQVRLRMEARIRAKDEAK